MGERRVEYLTPEELLPAERNPKAHDLPAIRRSLHRFGLVDLIHRDDRTGRIVAGHGRGEAIVAALAEMRAAGEVPPERWGISVEGDEWRIPVVCGWASTDDAEALAVGIALNRIGEGLWETPDLAAVLDELTALDATLPSIVGFEPPDLSALMESIGANGQPVPTRSVAQGYVERYSVDEIVELAAQHYEREGAFPYPEPMALHEKLWAVERLARTDVVDLAGTPAAMQVADDYHPERFSVEIAGRSGSPVAAFHDPEKLRHAIRMSVEMNGSVSRSRIRNMLLLVKGTQCAANFRPGFALLAMRLWCPAGGTVLDTSAGWAVGWSALLPARPVNTSALTRAVCRSTATLVWRLTFVLRIECG